MRNRGLLAILLFGLLFSVSCDSLDPQAKQRKAAVAASEKFFADWNAHNWISILENAQPELVRLKNPDDQRTLLGNTRGRMGAILSAKEISGHSMNFPDGPHYFLKYDAEFEAGKGTISLAWRTAGGPAELTGWGVQSPVFEKPE
jgi:hypothetical protein